MVKDRLFLLILLVSFFFFFWRLGDTYLVNWDEAWIGSVVKDAFYRRQPLDFRWQGNPWFYEPPLVLLGTYGSYLLFGISEFSSRVFVAFTAFLTVITVYLLAKILFKNRWSPVISSLSLLATIEFLFRARRLDTEVPLTFFLTLTVYAVFLGVKGNSRAFFIAAISFALALLTKRIEALLLLPFLSLVFFEARKALPARAMLLFFIILLPWHLYAYLHYGQSFVEGYFKEYTLGKLLSVNPISGIHPFFYITSIIHALKFWTIPFALALFVAVLRLKKDPLVRYILLWITSFILPLMIIPIKASWYLLPVYPAVALLIGWAFSKKWMVFPFVILFVIQVFSYKASFIVPESIADQVNVAKDARRLVPKDDIFLLDDDYLPVASYYSERDVIPLRFDRRRENLIDIRAIRNYSSQSKKKFILTNRETIKELLFALENPSYEVIKESGDRMLIQIKPERL